MLWCSKRVSDICGMYYSVNAFYMAMVDTDMTAEASLNKKFNDPSALSAIVTPLYNFLVP